MQSSNHLNTNSKLSVDSTSEVPVNSETRPIDLETIERARRSQGGALLFEHMSARLRVAEADTTISLPTNGLVVIGRSEINKTQQVDIDLTQYGARVMGVSRRHAAIYRKDQSLYVEDMDSVNGSYLNGKRLIPGQPYLLHDKDEVRLGNLRCFIEFSK